MESVVKKALLSPMKTLKFCVSGEKKPPSWTKRGSKRQGTKVTTCADPRLLRSYQADLERERKLREAMNAQKNAERAAMRMHFRRKYQLTKDAKDSAQLRAAGRKVCLPRGLAEMVRPKAAERDDSFSLSQAFQRLSFSSNTHSHTTAAGAGAEPCRVM
ncbi:complexin-3-like [Pseudorasbora parva]|uniref:complexin-3-like n=1 Tax=Pseudorasbora parva TaxID=51549 RepID=UPI00351E406F